MASKNDNNKATPYASHINPLAGTDLLVWYQKDGYLYLESKAIDPPSSKKPGTKSAFANYDDDDIHDGSLKNKGGVSDLATDPTPKVPFGSSVAITTTSTNKMTYAFAIRDADKVLCMISPVYSPLGKITTDGVGIASCLINKKPHVYCIKKDNGINKIYNIDPFTANYVLTYDSYQPIDQSQLCALSMSVAGASPAPYVFYHQGGSKGSAGIYMGGVNVGSFQQIPTIKSLPDPTTPLAVCEYLGSVFLFHLNSDYYVSCTKYANGAWSRVFQPVTYDQANPNDNNLPLETDTLSGLAASADPDNERIIITYKKVSGDEDEDDGSPCNIYALLDPLSYPK